VRWPRRIAGPLRVVQREQGVYRCATIVHPRVQVAEPREARGHGREREIAGIAAIELAPLDRRRHGGALGRAHGVCRRDRAVLCVLVVVDEHPVPLFFPPLARRESWRSTLDVARERQCGPSNLVEGPSWLDPNVDVQTTFARRLRPADEPQVRERFPNDVTDGSHLAPFDGWHRIEIHA